MGGIKGTFLLTLIYSMPILYAIDQMTLMADTFCLFLISLIYLLISLNKEKYLYYALTLSSYLAITKSVYLFTHIILTISILFFLRKNILLKKIRLLLIILSSCSIIFFHNHQFGRKSFGPTGVDDFAGQTLLSNMLPYMNNCQQLVGLASTPQEKELFIKYCSDDSLTQFSPLKHLWHNDGLVYKLRHDEQINPQTFLNTSLRLMISFPLIPLTSIARNIFTSTVSPYYNLHWQFLDGKHFIEGCSNITQIFWDMGPQNYAEKCDQHNMKKNTEKNFIVFFSQLINRTTTFLSYILFCICVYFLISKKSSKMISVESKILFMFTLTNLILITLGSGFDARYYFFASLMIVMTFANFYKDKKMAP